MRLGVWTRYPHDRYGIKERAHITMPRTFRMVGLWHDLKIDLSPIPVKEVTNLYLE